MAYPKIIQGGMGAGVSSWELAKSVSQAGQLGVVSGTALDLILARKLQTGDPDGHIRRALDHFPDAEIADRIYDTFYIKGGKPSFEPFKPIPLLTHNPVKMLVELMVVGNFAEVFLAKEGHEAPVGINFLEKIQLATPFALYGAMLAGVDYVLMGAGIPREIPGIIDKFTHHENISLKITVDGATPEDIFCINFAPKTYFPGITENLKRPDFLAIVSSHTLAKMLKIKSTGTVNGFIVEEPTAGGHNAPPRGKLTLNEKGEPVYGDRDTIDIEKIKKLGLPFWMAGSWGSSEKLKQALSLGAQGIQVGTAFAFTRESGFSASIKKQVIQNVKKGNLDVLTDPRVSPTGFPFKVLSLPGTLSQETEYQNRSRICDEGYLRHLYKKSDNSIGYRCPAEPVDLYIKKGGTLEETKGRKCLCNALMANLDLGQCRKDGYIEKTLVTAGNDIPSISRYLKNGKDTYSVMDVIDYLLEST